ncbi:hypothetical protein OH492_12925 [Vibrio chagasii]|nr:hypothetical protein [Vibrio chagasii]
MASQLLRDLLRAAIIGADVNIVNGTPDIIELQPQRPKRSDLMEENLVEPAICYRRG